MKKRLYMRIIIIAALVLSATGVMLAVSDGWLLAAEARPKAADVPNATLIVGTHLIALSAITDEISAVAEDSAKATGQNNVYYKSEIDSTWYDITNTEKVLSKPVANTVIDNLIVNSLTHWTKADGKTYDLANGQAVRIHELRDLAKPQTVTEANPLVNLKQVQESLAKNEKDKDAKARINFAITILNDLIQEIDATAASNAFASLKSQFASIDKVSYEDYRMSMILGEGGGTREVMLAFNIGETEASQRMATYRNNVLNERIVFNEEFAQEQLRSYYRILAKDTEAQIAGSTDLPAKRRDINAYDDFLVYLRSQKEADSTVELAVAEKAQLQAVYDMACVMVMIERLNSGLSLAKMLPAEDVAAVLTDVLNAYQDMLGELEEAVRGEPTTILLEMYQAKADSMTAQVRGGGYPGARTTLQSLASINNCLKNVQADTDGELAALDEAIPKSLAKINDYFKTGEQRVYEKTLEGEAVRSYALAKADKNPAAALEGLKASGISGNKTLLDEYSMLLELYQKRGLLEAHTALLRSGITNLEALAKTLPRDDFRTENYQLLQSAIDQMYAALAANLRLGDDDYQRQLAEQQALQEQLRQLNNDYLDAMLKGDFAKADALLAQIEDLTDQGAGYSNNNLQDYMDLTERLDLLNSLLKDIDAEEKLGPPEGLTPEEFAEQLAARREDLLAQRRDLQAHIEALKEQDSLIAAVDSAGVANTLAGSVNAGREILSSLVMALVAQYNLDLDPNVLADLQTAENLPVDGLALTMMRPVLERLLLRDALDSGLLDAAGKDTAQVLLGRTLTAILNNEINKYGLGETVDLYGRSQKFGAIGHETGALHNSSVILGYNQMRFTAPLLMFQGLVYVPIHETMAYFGAQTVHLKERDRIVLQAPNLYVELTAGKSEAYVNDVYREMPGPVLDYDFVLYAPASFLAEVVNVPWEFIPADPPEREEPLFIFYYF